MDVNNNAAYGVSVPSNNRAYGVHVPSNNPAYGVSVPSKNPAYGVHVPSNNPAYGVSVPFNNPAYGVSKQNSDGQLPTSEAQYEDVDLPATDNTNDDDEGITGDAQEELKNSSSRNSSLVIGIALSTAVLAVVVAVVCVGQSTSLSSKLVDLQLSLNLSVKAIEDLGQSISALQTDTATQYGILNITVNGIQITIREHSDLLNKLNSKGSITNPATSCSEIPTDRPSGEYWILGNSSSVQVYCDMNRTCCNTTEGWMRVANLDMTDPNHQCPDGFLPHNETTAPLRTCGRPGPGCVSTTFPVHGIEYSHVCGRVKGYQFGSPDAFMNYYNNRALTINDIYVEGVSLTHGQSPRKHIWTFVCALDEIASRDLSMCPCTQSDNTFTGVVPPFIGQDYFCDTGSRNGFQFTIYSDDPLWNGKGCGGNSTCCSFNNPPWFCKQLPQPTTDDIELRLCASEIITHEDIFLELVDIFVQKISID